MPPSCMIDGVHSQHFFGTGVIIYHSRSMGLVVVDKNTVAISASDVMLSFAAFPIEIPGEVNLSNMNNEKQFFSMLIKVPTFYCRWSFYIQFIILL